jgi:hypothetical protein
MFKLMTVLALAMSALFFSSQALAQGANGTPRSRPMMKHVAPTFGSNPLLSAFSEEGDDATSISLDPTLSALCQDFLGQPNPYANPAPNVDAIVNDAVVQTGSQTGCSSAQNETTIDVNPNNPTNLVAGANDYRLFNTRENRNDSTAVAYTSANGGATWTNVVLPHLNFPTGATGPLSAMDAAGDPAVAFGPNNTVYYANIAFSRVPSGNQLPSAIVVSKSTDGGLTWGDPSIVQLDGVDSSGNPVTTPFFNDKEWIAVDPASGAVYVTWTRYAFDSSGNFIRSPIVVSKSTDGGTTWSPFVEVNGTFVNGVTPYSQGSNPKVGRNGDLYIAYETSICQTLACNQPTDHDATVVAKSTNGGSTFTNTVVGTNFDFPFNEDTGTLALTGENFRINSYPQLSIDSKTGRLYVTWADDRNGQYAADGESIKSDGDVLLSTSANGTAWTKLYTIGSSADEVFPAVAAYNARFVVSYYTRAYDPNGINLDFAYTSATGLPNNLPNPTRITTESQNPQVQFVGIGLQSGTVLQGEFIGDYTGVTLGSDLVAHPMWTDFRGRPGVNTPNQDAYTQAIPLK